MKKRPGLPIFKKTLNEERGPFLAPADRLLKLNDCFVNFKRKKCSMVWN